MLQLSKPTWTRESGFNAAACALVEDPKSARLVKWCANYFARRYLFLRNRQCELESEGFAGLMTAAPRFDPERGVQFNTYAKPYVMEEMRRFVRANYSIVAHTRTTFDAQMQINKARREDPRWTELPTGDPGFSEAFDGADYLTPDAIIEADETGADFTARLDAATAILDARETEIIRRRHLTETPATLADLSAEYGVSAQRVQQIEAKALKKAKAKYVQLPDGMGRAMRRARADNIGYAAELKALAPPKDELVTRHQPQRAAKVTLRHAVTGQFGYVDPIPAEFDARMRAQITRTQKRAQAERAERRAWRMRAIAAGLSWAVRQ